MKSSVEDFIKTCISVIADHKAGKLTQRDAAVKINASRFEFPFEGPTHPMIYKIVDTAFDISEDYRSESENKADWDILTKTLDRYIAGDWESTCWIMSAMYGEFTKDTFTHSYSVSVRRQTGETLVNTASDEIEKAFATVIKSVNVEQTDERYLQNLASILPKTIHKFNLMSAEVQEYLTEPYYSNHF